MINVAVAVIYLNGTILIQQKRLDHKREYLRGRWEFPGGKIEDNETVYEALYREIREELSIEIRAVKSLGSFYTQYPGGLQNKLHVFKCEIVGGGIMPCDGQEQVRWIMPYELQDYQPQLDKMQDMLENL